MILCNSVTRFRKIIGYRFLVIEIRFWYFEILPEPIFVFWNLFSMKILLKKKLFY